jgi:dipeptide transport system permease protein
MLQYLAQRLLQAVPVLIGISVLTFAMMHLVPGDPVLIFAGDKPLTEERAAEIR